jgi:hypothetical protein
MKKFTLCLTANILLTVTSGTYCRQNNKSVFDKANNIVTKISNIITVFQPYLLTTRILYYNTYRANTPHNIQASFPATNRTIHNSHLS